MFGLNQRWPEKRSSCLCSPCLKLKPVSKGTKSGYLMANVEPYGGGLWHTWFDRDLTVAGRAIVKQDGRMAHRLVRHSLKSIPPFPNPLSFRP